MKTLLVLCLATVGFAGLASAGTVGTHHRYARHHHYAHHHHYHHHHHVAVR